MQRCKSLERLEGIADKTGRKICGLSNTPEVTSVKGKEPWPQTEFETGYASSLPSPPPGRFCERQDGLQKELKPFWKQQAISFASRDAFAAPSA